MKNKELSAGALRAAAMIDEAIGDTMGYVHSSKFIEKIGSIIDEETGLKELVEEIRVDDLEATGMEKQIQKLEAQLAAVVGVLTTLHATPNASSEFWEIVNTLDKTLSSLPKAREPYAGEVDRHYLENHNKSLQAENETLRKALEAQKHHSVDIMNRPVFREDDCWCGGVDGHSPACIIAKAALEPKK